MRTRAGERMAPWMRSQHFLGKALALLVCTALVPERAFATDCDPQTGGLCQGAGPGLLVPCPFCPACPEDNPPPSCHCECP